MTCGYISLKQFEAAAYQVRVPFDPYLLVVIVCCQLWSWYYLLGKEQWDLVDLAIKLYAKRVDLADQGHFEISQNDIGTENGKEKSTILTSLSNKSIKSLSQMISITVMWLGCSCILLVTIVLSWHNGYIDLVYTLPLWFTSQSKQYFTNIFVSKIFSGMESSFSRYPLLRNSWIYSQKDW